MVLIGFLGRSGSGKDTSADYLCSKYGFIKRSFAEPLKRACQELFLFSDDQVFVHKELGDPKWFGVTPRKVLQFVGTDLLRSKMSEIIPEIGEDIFIHNFRLWYESRSVEHITVPDLRFQNEVDLIHELGGTVIKLVRDSGSPVSDHQSEAVVDSIKNYDLSFDNSRELEVLHRKLDEFIKTQF